MNKVVNLMSWAMPANTRILVVDDDQEIRELLESTSPKSGFDVSSVGDGIELDTHLQNQVILI